MMCFQAGAGAMASSVNSDTTPVRVLIIEGHPAVRSALCKRLSATPQLEIVTTVGDVSGALSWMEPQDIDASVAVRETPDVIVMGLRNGTDSDMLDMVQEIRSLKRHPAAIVILAPYADEVERVLLESAGVKRYLLKQINSQQLIGEIQTAALEEARGVP